MIKVQEQPFRSLSVLSQFLIYRHVSQNSQIKVLLNGQGADEVFTGYDEHYAFNILNNVFGLRCGLALLNLIKFKQTKQKSYLGVFIWISKNLFSSRYSIRNKNDLFKKTFKSKKIFKNFKRLNYFKSKLLHGIQVTALKEYLRYEDRNSMFFGLEARLPFLDYKAVQQGRFPMSLL